MSKRKIVISLFIVLMLTAGAVFLIKRDQSAVFAGCQNIGEDIIEDAARFTDLNQADTASVAAGLVQAIDVMESTCIDYTASKDYYYVALHLAYLRAESENLEDYFTRYTQLSEDDFRIAQITTIATDDELRDRIDVAKRHNETVKKLQSEVPPIPVPEGT